MTTNLPLLAMAAFLYMLLLFLIAYATDQGWIPRRIVRHPLTFSLSLGVYATTWTFYGSVGFAAEQGYNFLTIYLGVTLAFMLTPVLLAPLLKLTWDYQLTSLADLFAFRFRSQAAGVMVTLVMLLGALPYIALQIRAVTDSIYILTKEASPDLLALGFCVFLTVFAILFGARHVTAREKHAGLVVAIAFESVVKLFALLVVAALTLVGVWGGPQGLVEWVAGHPEAVEALYAPVREGPWLSLLLLAFAASFLLPRQFHMIFTENDNPGALPVASWAFPLYLLLLNLPIPLFLWAGHVLDLEVPADYYVLGVTLAGGKPSLLPVLAFIGGVSAASAMVIVSTLALSSMCLNHLLLPASYPDPVLDIYRWLLWGRRLLITLIVLAGYGFYRLLEHNEGLVQLGLISFVAVAQFLPGIIGVLVWRRATRDGFLAGLAGGFAMWTITLLLPLLEESGLVGTGFSGLWAGSGMDKWVFATFWTLAVNGVLFTLVSLISRQRETEREAAQACCSEILALPEGVVDAQSPSQFRIHLGAVMGHEVAAREVARALADLGMNAQETRPLELRRLRERLERNLSGLIGPQLAHLVVSQRLQLTRGAQTALSESMRYVEQRLAESHRKLHGIAAELDALHRYHKHILQDLPLGVCALSPDGEVVIWNLSMEMISGVSSLRTVGLSVARLPMPWSDVLLEFSSNSDNHLHRVNVNVDGRERWFNLHKAAILASGSKPSREGEPSLGVVMLVEDLTELETLEAELAHSERLASVGRLAAGFAHEIGNPVTGIACLAQNLKDEQDPIEMRSGVSQILEQTSRITRILRSLMTFSHVGEDSGEWSVFDIALALDEAVQLVRLSRHRKSIDCALHAPQGVCVRGDRPRLTQMLVNLLTNACDASEAGSVVEIFVEQRQGRVVMEVQDHGCGIPEDAHSRIFEPFFTTKRPGEGTGLGLPLVYKIVRDHQGVIHVDSKPGIGTRVIVDLPMVEPQPRRASV